MAEDHRRQQAEPLGEPDGDLEGAGLEETDREEEHRERSGGGAGALVDQVGDERLDDEAAAETIEGKQRRELRDRASRAWERRVR